MRAVALQLLVASSAYGEGDGFRTLSLFVGQRTEQGVAAGMPPDSTCRKQGFCDQPGTWYSQSGQDRVVGKAIFQGKRGGYFVDLAANHPLLKSNTRTIERDFGWRGLCIDGNEEFLMLLLKRRTCQVVGAIVSSEADADVQYRRWHGGGGAGSTGTWQHALSGIVGFDNKADNGSDPIINKYASKTDKGPGYRDVKSASTRLEDILRRHNAPSTIEYLSLDVEGAEEAVMRNFAFDSYTFLVVTIERPSENLQRILATKGYVFVTDMPGGFGEKLFLHNAIPGGVAAVTVRVQAEIVQYEADKEALKRKKG